MLKIRTGQNKPSQVGHQLVANPNNDHLIVYTVSTQSLMGAKTYCSFEDAKSRLDSLPLGHGLKVFKHRVYYNSAKIQTTLMGETGDEVIAYAPKYFDSNGTSFSKIHYPKKPTNNYYSPPPPLTASYPKMSPAQKKKIAETLAKMLKIHDLGEKKV